MDAPKKVLHLIDLFDGYGPSRQLELLVQRQQHDGMSPRVIAMRATKFGRRRLQQLATDARVLDRRWQCDPFVATRLIGELRNSDAELLHLWDSTATTYAQYVQRFASHGASCLSLPEREAPIGIEPIEKSAISREAFCQRYQLPKDGPLIAVAGPLVRSQGIDDAIWHFELVRTLNTASRLLIFGDGPDRHRLERFARLTSEPSAMRFLGEPEHLEANDYRSLLGLANVFWHTATHDASPSQTVLEAMAVGVPVIANASTHCRNIIDDGSSGFLVSENPRAVFARHTRKLLADAKLAGDVAASARQKVLADYSLASMHEAYLSRYSEAMTAKQAA